MIFTKKLKYDDIASKLDKSDKITIIGCENCARLAGVSTEESIIELATKLKDDGFDVEGAYTIPTSCTPKVLFAKIKDDVNVVISLSCNAGTTNIARILADKNVVSGADDIGLMVEDCKKHLIEITMPYPSHEDEKGNMYHALTGEKVDCESIMKTEVER